MHFEDFRKDDIKFNVNESGTIIISGRRKIGEDKQKHFERTFDVPENGDIKNITMKFDGDALTVFIPKLDKQANEKPETKTALTSNNQSHENENKEKEKEKEKPETAVSGKEIKEKERFEKPATSSKTIKEESEKPETAISDKEIKEKERFEKPATSSNTIKEESERPETAILSKDIKEKEDIEKPDLSKKLKGDKMNRKEGEKTEKTVIVKIIENKGIFLASIISFTLGVLFSQKYHQTPSK